MNFIDNATTQRGNKMTINTFNMKFLGKKITMFRVLDNNGEVLQVLETKEEAEAWIASKS
jgi:hypothetical protein